MGHKDATITLAIYTQLWDDDATSDADLLSRPASTTNVTSISKRLGT